MAPREMFPSPIPKYPSLRDDSLKSPVVWLKGKQIDDGAEGLWRIHDDLYDFSAWIKNHPGGSDWLTLTKGTDITEAFESHHISVTASLLLKHFHVREATSPRNSPYTFHEDGFYKTLKKRVREELKGKSTSPTIGALLITDFLCGGALALAVVAAANSCYATGLLSGILLAFTVVAAHNFSHQKNNFRMHYFDLSLMTNKEWRISHVLSHHLYPNSLLDLELSLFEPAFQFLPDPSKSWIARYGPIFYFPFFYSFMNVFNIVTRMTLLRKGYIDSLTKEDAIPLIVPGLMLLFSGCGLKDAMLMWLWIIVVTGFFFGAIGLNGAHHHPDIFHDGDAPRVDRDWGLAQLDTCRDRPAVNQVLITVLTNFGHHSLHHLFPTVDHSVLHHLYPIVRQTCKEFKVHYPELGIVEGYKGQFRQIIRNEPNIIPPGSS